MTDELVDLLDRARGAKTDAERAKREANLDRKTGDLDEAVLGMTEGVIPPLAAALRELDDNRSLLERENEDSLRKEIATDLADAHGSLGGMLRRRAELARTKEAWLEALDSYAAGRRIEQDEEGRGYGIVNSYNLVNDLVCRLLSGVPLADLRDAAGRAAETVRTQVEKLGRADDWWALADLGFLEALQGSEAAGETYEQYRASGVPEWAVQSALDVLFDCRGAIHAGEHPGDVGPLNSATNLIATSDLVVVSGPEVLHAGALVDVLRDRGIRMPVAPASDEEPLQPEHGARYAKYLLVARDSRECTAAQVWKDNGRDPERILSTSAANITQPVGEDGEADVLAEKIRALLLED